MGFVCIFENLQMTVLSAATHIDKEAAEPGISVAYARLLGQPFQRLSSVCSAGESGLQWLSCGLMLIHTCRPCTNPCLHSMMLRRHCLILVRAVFTFYSYPCRLCT